jgi:hypothetical protein
MDESIAIIVGIAFAAAVIFAAIYSNPAFGFN